MNQKPMKIFISHSSQDLAYVQLLVELFRHMGLTAEDMFCSSVPGYNVPLDNNIFDYLKEQFQNYELRVIFVLSENYYSSAASLNEMGAAWILQHRYTSILIPHFDFRDIKGVIDQMRISIKLDSDKMELKARLNELRNTLTNEFGLKTSLAELNIWERYRDDFVEKVSSAEIYWSKLNQLRANRRPFSEWISPLQKLIEINPSSYDAMYMLGIICAEMGDQKEAVKNLKMVATFSPSTELQEKANHKLQDFGCAL